MAEGVCIPRSALYMHYLDFSEKHDTQPVNAASFGKVGSKTQKSSSALRKHTVLFSWCKSVWFVWYMMFVLFFLKLLRRFGCCKPKIIPPSESSSVFNLTVSWPGVVLVGAAALISPAAQCEAAKALCLCSEHLISSQRRCAFVCSHNPEKFLSLATLSHSLYSGPRPQPPTQPTPPTPGQLLSEDIEKEKGPGLMCN